MRFGVCTGIDNAGILAQAGYDYIELSAAGDLMPDTPESAWADTRRRIDAMPLRPEAFNSFIRAGKIVGPEADWERLRRYTDTVCQRAFLVGGKTLVLGSAGARNVPEGYEREAADADLMRFLGLCADAAETYGVRVVIEPLNRDESNFINTVAEGATYTRRVGRAGVQNLADTYHMEKEGEPLQTLLDNSDTLAHVHTADTHRDAPGTGTYDHRALFAALYRAGYGGPDARLSVECRWSDLARQAPDALAHLKQAYIE